MSAQGIVAEVAGAVRLAEGEAGVVDVVRTVARLGPVAVRTISRATELPVPLVSAICNELRRRGVVDERRPVRLTPLGLDLFGDVNGRVAFEATCGRCEGRGLAVPRALTSVVRELRTLADAAPRARLEIDQCHCTVDTKVRRVLAMYEAGALGGRRLMVLGDDDLMSVAIRLVAERLGRPASIRSVTVVDIDPSVVEFVEKAMRGTRFTVDAVVHDLRKPLPARLAGSADTVFTDPPYTNAGAELFLSRAAQATCGAAGRDVFLAFGAKRPEDVLGLQRAIGEMGFLVRRLMPSFNDYLGAGVRGGTSHLYQLRTTNELRPLLHGAYEGPLYTAEVASRSRSAA